ncbi:hypothetical protein BU17DRAFT_63098 [Hysterangium stoloniferum]|nr:hypothetical protein BU17DRAFT_63098 [Hysterangium stoloniferum]
MNSFRSILALLSIIGLVSAAPQGGAVTNGAACGLDFAGVYKGCAESLAEHPNVLTTCLESNSVDFPGDAECYNEFKTLGLISGACMAGAELFDPSLSSPSPPSPAAPA